MDAPVVAIEGDEYLSLPQKMEKMKKVLYVKAIYYE